MKRTRKPFYNTRTFFAVFVITTILSGTTLLFGPVFGQPTSKAWGIVKGLFVSAPVPVLHSAPETAYEVRGRVRLFDGSIFRDSLVSVFNLQGTQLYLLQTDSEGAYVFAGIAGESYAIRPSQPSYAYAPPEFKTGPISAPVTANFYAGPDSWFPPRCDAPFGEIAPPSITPWSGPLPASAPQAYYDFGKGVNIVAHATNGTTSEQYSAMWNFRTGSTPTNQPCFMEAWITVMPNGDGSCCTWTTNDSQMSGTGVSVTNARYFLVPPFPSPSPSPSVSPSPSPSPSPSATPTPTPSPTATPTPTPSTTPSPSPSPCRRLPNGRLKCGKN